MGRGGHHGPRKTCGNDYEGYSEEDARERHNDNEDHPFVKK